MPPGWSAHGAVLVGDEGDETEAQSESKSEEVGDLNVDAAVLRAMAPISASMTELALLLERVCLLPVVLVSMLLYDIMVDDRLRRL